MDKQKASINLIEKLIAKKDASFEKYVQSSNPVNRKLAVLYFIDLYFGPQYRDEGMIVIRDGELVPAITKILFDTDKLSEEYLQLNDELPIIEYFVDKNNYFVLTTHSFYRMVDGNYASGRYVDIINISVLPEFLLNELANFVKVRFETKKGNVKVKLENRMPFKLCVNIMTLFDPRCLL